jgi:hypothetical protein
MFVYSPREVAEKPERLERVNSWIERCGEKKTQSLRNGKPISQQKQNLFV